MTVTKDNLKIQQKEKNILKKENLKKDISQENKILN